MRAVRLQAWGHDPVLEDVPPRAPGPGEAMVKVLAAGLCHSDLHLVKGAVASSVTFAPPFTLGHEIAGEVVEIDDDVTGVSIGDHVAVYGPTGCGTCASCSIGAQNHCDRRGHVTAVGVGLGIDGGMADYVTVDAARLIEIGDLDPATAAVLTDGGLTPYHAVTTTPLGPDPVAVVIGIGGLGHVAVQLLVMLTNARVIAVDRRQAAADLARAAGANAAVTDLSDLPGAVATTGHGADAVFDFVGARETLEAAAGILRPGGELSIVGSGGGTIEIGRLGRLPFGARVSTPFWGSLQELREVIALARAGELRIHTTPYALDDALDAFADLQHGRLLGRAVLIP